MKSRPPHTARAVVHTRPGTALRWYIHLQYIYRVYKRASGLLVQTMNAIEAEEAAAAREAEEAAAAREARVAAEAEAAWQREAEAEAAREAARSDSARSVSARSDSALSTSRSLSVSMGPACGEEGVDTHHRCQNARAEGAKVLSEEKA